VPPARGYPGVRRALARQRAAAAEQAVVARAQIALWLALAVVLAVCGLEAGDVLRGAAS